MQNIHTLRNRYPRLLTGWGVMRLIRLGLGIYMSVTFLMGAPWHFGLLGGILLVTSVLNVGCCGGGACAPRTNADAPPADGDTVRYEEVLPGTERKG